MENAKLLIEYNIMCMREVEQLQLEKQKLDEELRAVEMTGPGGYQPRGESEPPYRSRGRGHRRGRGRRGGYHSDREGSAGLATSDWSDAEGRGGSGRGRGNRTQSGWRRRERNQAQQDPLGSDLLNGIKDRELNHRLLIIDY